MPRVDFYLLENPSPEAVYLTVCKLCDKAYQQQQHVTIHAKNAQEVQKIDALLWTYHDISFLPHSLKDPNAPIFIGILTTLPEKHDILINLDQAVPSLFNGFNRVIEVVSATETERANARERFRFYRKNLCEPNSHTLRS